MNRGIDPATHRPMNEAAAAAAAAQVEATTISFAAVKEEEKSTSGFSGKDTKIPVQEKCPDLNLELRISPPSHNQSEPMKSGGRVTICFSCSLGVQNSKECSCRNDSVGSSSSDSSATGYDFLGLNGVVLDYRSLEMKWDGELGLKLCNINRLMERTWERDWY